MLREDLLIEIGTEELPPTALKTLATALADNLQLQLAKANINFTSVKWFATPRRLAVLFTETDTKQVDVVVEKRGPAVKAAFDQDGNATKAALGWARGNGIEVSQASRLVTDKGEWLLHNATVIGKHLKDVIHPLIDTALNQLPIPKPMRWGSNDVQFIRPIKSICVMAGEQLLSGKVFNIEVSRTLQGHRFHGDQQFELAHANQYEQQLQQQYVVADFEKRKSMIQQQVSVLEQSSDARADFDDTLLEEVTALVEWPVTLCANFDERFLAVPKEALIYTMKGDQKYFPLLDGNGQLLPKFLFVTNIESKDPKQIILGNEKVIRPRLADAEFFFETDKKQTLADRLESLDSVLFQKQLGTLKQKSERIAKLSGFVAKQIGANELQASRAGLLSKTDLMTEMVMEFTDIQGVMGMHYARIDGEDEAVALAMDEQYKPRFSGDALPQSPVSCALAIADKLDTLCGIFGIGQIPKGDKDPFALRRAAIGLLRIIQHNTLPLDLNTLVQHSVSLFGDLLSNSNTQQDVVNFIFSRYPSLYSARGIDTNLINAVIAKKPLFPADFDARVLGVTSFSKLAEANSLAAANKRVANILAKSEISAVGNIDKALFDSEQEARLYIAIQAVEATVMDYVETKEYSKALAELAQLQQPIDDFFDNVMVMAEDQAIRQNRMELLAKIRGMFMQIADISELSR